MKHKIYSSIIKNYDELTSAIKECKTMDQLNCKCFNCNNTFLLLGQSLSQSCFQFAVLLLEFAVLAVFPDHLLRGSDIPPIQIIQYIHIGFLSVPRSTDFCLTVERGSF
mgnify:CR=1 FL=1